MTTTSLLRNFSHFFIKRNFIYSARNFSKVLISYNNKNHFQNQPTFYQQKIHMDNRFMTTVAAISNIGFDKLKEYQNNKAATIIDVRENDEIKETGLLPGAIHIPLGEVSTAFKENAGIFEKKYNHCKPEKDNIIIFSCRSGKRSMVAAQTLESLGYKNIINYAGGWLDWESHLTK